MVFKRDSLMKNGFSLKTARLSCSGQNNMLKGGGGGGVGGGILAISEMLSNVLFNHFGMSPPAIL